MPVIIGILTINYAFYFLKHSITSLICFLHASVLANNCFIIYMYEIFDQNNILIFIVF